MFLKRKEIQQATGSKISSFRKLVLYPSELMLGNRIVKYSDVQRIYCDVRKVSEGFGYTTYTKLMVCTNMDKRPLKFHYKAQFSAAAVMPVFWSMYEILQNQTRQYRAQYYARQIDEKGYIDYDKGIRITRCGTIERSGFGVRLSVAKDKGVLQIGTEYGYPNTNYKRDPSEVVVSEGAGGLVIRFNIRYDQDIISNIIELLSGGNSVD